MINSLKIAAGNPGLFFGAPAGGSVPDNADSTRDLSGPYSNLPSKVKSIVSEKAYAELLRALDWVKDGFVQAVEADINKNWEHRDYLAKKYLGYLKDSKYTGSAAISGFFQDLFIVIPEIEAEMADSVRLSLEKKSTSVSLINETIFDYKYVENDFKFSILERFLNECSAKLSAEGEHQYAEILLPKPRNAKATSGTAGIENNDPAPPLDSAGSSPAGKGEWSLQKIQEDISEGSAEIRARKFLYEAFPALKLAVADYNNARASQSAPRQIYMDLYFVMDNVLSEVIADIFEEAKQNKNILTDSEFLKEKAESVIEKLKNDENKTLAEFLRTLFSQCPEIESSFRNNFINCVRELPENALAWSLHAEKEGFYSLLAPHKYTPKHFINEMFFLRHADHTHTHLTTRIKNVIKDFYLKFDTDLPEEPNDARRALVNNRILYDYKTFKNKKDIPFNIYYQINILIRRIMNRVYTGSNAPGVNAADLTRRSVGEGLSAAGADPAKNLARMLFSLELDGKSVKELFIEEAAGYVLEEPSGNKSTGRVINGILSKLLETSRADESLAGRIREAFMQYAAQSMEIAKEVQADLLKVLEETRAAQTENNAELEKDNNFTEEKPETTREKFKKIQAVSDKRAQDAWDTASIAKELAQTEKYIAVNDMLNAFNDYKGALSDKRADKGFVEQKRQNLEDKLEIVAVAEEKIAGFLRETDEILREIITYESEMEKQWIEKISALEAEDKKTRVSVVEVEKPQFRPAVSASRTDDAEKTERQKPQLHQGKAADIKSALEEAVAAQEKYDSAAKRAREALKRAKEYDLDMDGASKRKRKKIKSAQSEMAAKLKKIDEDARLAQEQARASREAAGDPKTERDVKKAEILARMAGKKIQDALLAADEQRKIAQEEYDFNVREAEGEYQEYIRKATAAMLEAEKANRDLPMGKIKSAAMWEKVRVKGEESEKIKAAEAEKMYNEAKKEAVLVEKKVKTADKKAGEFSLSMYERWQTIKGDEAAEKKFREELNGDKRWSDLESAEEELWKRRKDLKKAKEGLAEIRQELHPAKEPVPGRKAGKNGKTEKIAARKNNAAGTRRTRNSGADYSAARVRVREAGITLTARIKGEVGGPAGFEPPSVRLSGRDLKAARNKGSVVVSQTNPIEIMGAEVRSALRIIRKYEDRLKNKPPKERANAIERLLYAQLKPKGYSQEFIRGLSNSAAMQIKNEGWFDFVLGRLELNPNIKININTRIPADRTIDFSGKEKEIKGKSGKSVKIK